MGDTVDQDMAVVERPKSHQVPTRLRRTKAAALPRLNAPSLASSVKMERKDEESQMVSNTLSASQRRQTRKTSTTSQHERSNIMSRSNSNTDRPSFTKTGRVSKAKKGLKVHECDQCGKIYSRAEHLRRHQFNHRTSPLRCQLCGRAFFRDDLLARHVVKYGHAEPGSSTQEQTRNNSLTVGSSDQISISPATTSEGGQFVVPKLEAEDYLRRQSTSSARYSQVSSSHDRISDFSSFPLSQLSSPEINAAYITTPYHNPSKPSWSDRGPYQLSAPSWTSGAFHPEPSLLPTSPASALTSPWPPPYQLQPAATTFGDQTRLFEFAQIDWSGLSSVQTTASNSPPDWNPARAMDADMAQLNATSQSSPMPVTAVPPLLMPASGSSDESISDGHLGVSLSNDRKRAYVEAYSRHFHPLFPILHKHRFTHHNKSSGGSLLLHAVMAIGAQYSTEPFAQADSRLLLERSFDALERRKLNPSTSTQIEVLQAVVLLEYLSHFRAKRGSERLSSLFISVYDLLWNIHLNNLTKSAIDRLSDVTNDSADSVQEQWLKWVETHSRERLLAACYILDSRQALLFARKNHTAAAASGLDLYVPVSNSVWDAPNAQQWKQRLPGFPPKTMSVFELLDSLETQPDMSCDIFPSALVVACYAASSTCRQSETSLEFANHSHPAFDPSNSAYLLRSLSPHPSIRIMGLAVQLISFSPFQQLVAVAGESWFFSKRLASDARSAADQFAHCKQEVRVWATLTTASSFVNIESPPDMTSSFSRAVLAAIHILNEAVNSPSPQTTLPFGPEIVLYIACLVLWSANLAAISRSGTQFSVFQPAAGDDPADWPPERTSAHVNSWLREALEYARTVIQPSTISTIPTTQTLSSTSVLQTTSGFYNPMPATTTYNIHGQPTMAVGSTLTTSAFLPPMEMLQSWRIGISAILRWSAWTIAGAGQGQAVSGELIEGVVGVLERLSKDGWTGRWF